MNDKPMPANWTPETIRRFWNYQGQKVINYNEYFSFQVGQGLVNLLRHTKCLDKGMNVLDFGCGPGFLLEQIVKTDNDCYGFDFSNESVDLVNNKLDGVVNWKGAITGTNLPVAYPSSTFDVVTCIEALEHLLDDMLFGTLEELGRLQSKDGVILITVPFAEKLEENLVYCPFCNIEFHKYQHVRSFDKESLSVMLKKNNYEVLFCENIDLFEFQMKLLSRNNFKLKTVIPLFKHYNNRLKDILSPNIHAETGIKIPRCISGANLCAIARYKK